MRLTQRQLRTLVESVILEQKVSENWPAIEYYPDIKEQLIQVITVLTQLDETADAYNKLRMKVPYDDWPAKTSTFFNKQAGSETYKTFVNTDFQKYIMSAWRTVTSIIQTKDTPKEDILRLLNRALSEIQPYIKFLDEVKKGTRDYQKLLLFGASWETKLSKDDVHAMINYDKGIRLKVKEASNLINEMINIRKDSKEHDTQIQSATPQESTSTSKEEETTKMFNKNDVVYAPSVIGYKGELTADSFIYTTSGAISGELTALAAKNPQFYYWASFDNDSEALLDSDYALSDMSKMSIVSTGKDGKGTRYAFPNDHITAVNAVDNTQTGEEKPVAQNTISKAATPSKSTSGKNSPKKYTWQWYFENTPSRASAEKIAEKWKEFSPNSTSFRSWAKWYHTLRKTGKTGTATNYGRFKGEKKPDPSGGLHLQPDEIASILDDLISSGRAINEVVNNNTLYRLRYRRRY
jgi:hypothetical protein